MEKPRTDKETLQKADIRGHVLEGTPEDVIARYEALVDKAANTDFGRLDSNVVVVDTETTGFSFNHDELIQIAAARIEQGQIADWYVTFVNPGKPIPDEISHLTNIYDSDVADAPSPEEALAAMVDFAGDAIMVAHNANFDRTFLTRHPQGYPLLENIWVDSLDLSRICLPRLKGHRLIDLVHTFGAPVSTHRADDDVAATCMVYRVLLAAALSMPYALASKIASLAPVDEWPTGYVFDYLVNHVWDGAVEAPESASVNAQVGERRTEETDDTSAQNEKQASDQRQFSLYTMRKRRIKTLPARRVREDADAIAADPARSLTFPSADEIAHAFTSDGILGTIYGDYEARDEQRVMAQAVAEAFESSENLAVEAGTGVGKSMAYLVPSALTAQRNGISVGISTKTNALLDQLVYQELPALADALAQNDPSAEPLAWASLKGMTHYPCLRKVNRLVEAGPTMKEVNGALVSQAPALAALLSFIEQTEYGDLDALKLDFRSLPRYLMTTASTECLRRKCPYYNSLCFVHGARRRAEAADIVVTNHALLFCNLAAEGNLLPPIRHWVVDEAHGAEEEARRAFTSTVSSEEVLDLARALSDASGARNVVARAERQVKAQEAEQITLFYGLSSKIRSAGNAYAQAAEEYTLHVKDLLYFDPSSKSKGYDNVDLWINDDVRKTEVFSRVAEYAHELIERADKAVMACQELVAYLEGIDEAAESQREIASTAMRLKDVRNAAELVFEIAPENYVYQAALVKKKDRRVDKVEALLLDVGATMNETLFASTHSVVFASATLCVNGRFSSFENAIGLNQGEFSQARTLLLDSSYDFDNNMLIYVVSDMPEPTDGKYLEALTRLLVAVHRAQKGSMLTLFTNRNEMERCFSEVQAQLKQDDLRVICQKWGVSVKNLRDEFLADERLSLFALKSFWEGFDAPGATLKGVVIPKLPFARPTDPLSCERAARDDRAWNRYVLPKAVIETKQAAGRLIRKADDHGVLILADKRLISKNYGKTFLNSLQSKTVRVCTTDEIVRALTLMGEW